VLGRWLGFLWVGPVLALASTITLLPARAGAQHDLDLQLFLPPAAGGSTFTIDRPSVPRHLNAVFGISGNYALEPFVRSEARAQDGTVTLPGAPVVRHLVQLEALAALGLFEYLELGVAVPVVITDAATDRNLFEPNYTYGTRAGMGDLRLSAKIPLLRGDFSLAARLVIQLPTSALNGYPNSFEGMDYWIATPTAVVAWDPGPLTIAGEVGYRFRQRSAIGGFEQDDEIQIAAGVSVPVVEDVEIIGETQLRIGAGGRELRANEIPWEADVGVRVWPVRGLSIEGGLGTGILAGYGATPIRAFVALRFATDQGESCAEGPEDFDGFEDGDFCADLDNDRDRIPDADDQCVNDAEDVDGFADDDGCPDTDNDADGVADGLDECPMEPEDQDRFQDEDGCPEPGPEAASVTVTDTRILISERIYFDYDRDTIRSVSMPMLDQVARVVLELRGELRVRVDGYTDNEGVAQYNLDLSYRRARAVVEYLVGRGVPRSRLEYRGYGPRNPVAPNDTPDGRALNRRVEFTILNEGERAGRPRGGR